MNVEKVLQKHGIRPDPEKDQHFLSDEKLISDVVSALDVRPSDIVYEVGAGIGSLTDSIPPCKKIYAVDIDPTLCKVLHSELKGTSIEVVEANALVHMQTVTFSKLLSSTPYSICEPLIKELFVAPFERAVLIVPALLAEKLSSPDSQLGFFSRLFLEINELFLLPRTSFDPRPRTDSIVLLITRKPAHPAQSIYLYRHMKVKNILRESIIRSHGLTKRMSRELISSQINREILEKKPLALKVKELELVLAVLTSKS